MLRRTGTKNNHVRTFIEPRRHARARKQRKQVRSFLQMVEKRYQRHDPALLDLIEKVRSLTAMVVEESDEAPSFLGWFVDEQPEELEELVVAALCFIEYQAAERLS